MEYEVTIKETSKELTKRERIAIKDTTAMLSLDAESQHCEGTLMIDVDYYAILAIHNSKSQNNQDYDNLVIRDINGSYYYTGSTSFLKSFKAIADEMGDEAFSIRVYRKDSKNYSGKQFLSCTIM